MGSRRSEIRWSHDDERVRMVRLSRGSHALLMHARKTSGSVNTTVCVSQWRDKYDNAFVTTDTERLCEAKCVIRRVMVNGMETC
mmetsp:Transcript_67620/g.78505  ORF Transcript_67620/g.78505 Transcript_67620/m.78505 type:complete len:84 (+) Transcript_67620:108-359(+)